MRNITLRGTLYPKQGYKKIWLFLIKIHPSADLLVEIDLRDEESYPVLPKF